MVLLSRRLYDPYHLWKETEMNFPYKGLCYSIPAEQSIDPHNRGQIVQCDLFDEVEVKSITNAVISMECLFTNMDRSFAAEEALREFKAELNSLVSDNKYDIARVDRRFRAYVMEFRLFLDHWKKHISDLKKQDEKYSALYEKLYKDVTSSTYDSNDYYVLATVIRNYVVHGYDSINHAHVGDAAKEVFIDRDSLFKIDVAASARPVIQKQEEEINLLQVAQESFTALQTVQEQLMNFQITEEIGQAAVTLLNAKKRIDDAEISSKRWMLIGEQKPKEISWKGKMVQGIDLEYRIMNWDGYIAIAQYVAKLWQEGYWVEIQRKYSI